MKLVNRKEISQSERNQTKEKKLG